MGEPCLLLKLRQMETHKVQMKGIRPLWVHRACRTSTRDFCPALAALL
jgi:hypothetical protein